MAFIGSNNIVMFPSAKRNPTYDSTSRLTTEYNLVNLVNRLVCNDKLSYGSGFVITNKIDSTNKMLEFCIDGYYFRVEDYTQLVGLFSNPSSIYAAISVSSDLRVFNELQPLDNQGNPLTTTAEYPLDNSNGKFIGVNFLTSAPSTSGAMYLQILTKSSGTWEIPEGSKIRYVLKSPMRTDRKSVV